MVGQSGLKFWPPKISMNGLLAPFLGYKVGIGRVYISCVGGLTGQLEPEAGFVLLLLWPELDMYDICILYYMMLIQVSAKAEMYAWVVARVSWSRKPASSSFCCGRSLAYQLIQNICHIIHI